MPSLFERHPKKTILIIIFVIFGVMDFVFSSVFNQIVENREKTGLGIPHKVYHHDFEKNGISHESGRLGNYTIYTNSLGFKDKSNRNISRRTNKHRIVFIGDSFTEGILLNYEDTFVGIIDSTVSENDIEILNAGRVSYSPIIYWRKVKYLIEDKKLKFDELVVFIDISDIDDEASYYDLSDDNNVISQNKKDAIDNQLLNDNNISWIDSKKIDGIRSFLRKHFIVSSYVINGIHDIIFTNYDKENTIDKLDSVARQDGIDIVKTVRSYNNWDYVLNDYRSNWTFDDKFYNDFGEKGKARMVKYMDKLKSLCDENSIKMTVVVYPWPSQIWYDDLESRHVGIWEDWTNKNNINLINLFPSFIKLNRSDTEKLKILYKYYVPYDLHFNRNGNELIAQEFLRYYL